MRFELIDRVLEQDSDHLVAVKTVTTAEEYLADHFPGFAVLPGVMMLEVLAQAARRLIAARCPDPASPLVVTDVRNVRYSNMVRPGQCLKVQVTLRKQDDQGFEFAGTGTVDGQTAVQGRFRLNRIQPMTIGADTPSSI